MPTFDTLSRRSAQEQCMPNKRAALLQEYIGYIRRLAPGEAGRLEAGDGETTQAIRRRLNAAAQALGKELHVRRSANAVYFWPSDNSRPRRRSVRRETLADVLHEHIGVLHSSEHGTAGASMSRDTGENFAAGLFEDYRSQQKSA